MPSCPARAAAQPPLTPCQTGPVRYRQFFLNPPLACGGVQPVNYDRRVSFDGVDFGWVCRGGWPDEIKWSFMSLDVCNDDNLRGITCDKEYDNLWQLRAELESLILKQFRTIARHR